MTISMFLPFILQLGFASITLDGGHMIKAGYVRSGTVAHQSGFIVPLSDMADIQASLRGNSCLIRVAKIKEDFEEEVRGINQRCDERLQVFKTSLTESQLLNEALKKQLKDEKSSYNKLLYSSIAGGVILTSTAIYFATK